MFGKLELSIIKHHLFNSELSIIKQHLFNSECLYEMLDSGGDHMFCEQSQQIK